MGKIYLIKDFLKRFKRPIKLIPDKEYKLVTISSKHRGIKLRELKKGSLIKSSMYEVKAGDFVLSGIDARNGAFGIIPEELDGGIITNDFWCLEINKSVISKELFLELTATTWFDELCNRGSDGTTNRVRLQKEKFFNQEVILPLKREQEHLLETILTIRGKSNVLKKEIGNQKQLISQLKQAILQEAIEGKLTQNWRTKNFDFEPASELLKRIKSEKEKLVKEKKIKKEKELPPILKEEIPFAIPKNWVWCRLGEIICNTENLDIQKYLKSNTIINYVDIDSIDNKKHIIREAKQLQVSELSSRARRVLKKGQILYSLVRPYLHNIAIVEDDRPNYIGSTGFAVFECLKVETQYIFRVLLSKYIESLYLGYMDGFNSPSITHDQFRNTIIPLPPISEQQSIVNIVETLMTYCSAIEKEIAASEEHIHILMQAVLKEAFENKVVKTDTAQMDRGIQLALIQMMFKQYLGINYGEVVMQKTVYNLDFLYHKDSSFFPYTFQSSNHGAFSVQLREEIESNPILTTKATDRGTVICVEPKQYSVVFDAFSNPLYKDYIQALIRILEIYSLPIIGKKTDQIELFNTVLKIMNDLNVKDIETIYATMEDWCIEQKGYKTKAEKFTKNETQRILDLILKLRAHYNL